MFGKQWRDRTLCASVHWIIVALRTKCAPSTLSTRRCSACAIRWLLGSSDNVCSSICAHRGKLLTELLFHYYQMRAADKRNERFHQIRAYSKKELLFHIVPLCRQSLVHWKVRLLSGPPNRTTSDVLERNASPGAQCTSTTLPMNWIDYWTPPNSQFFPRFFCCFVQTFAVQN